MKRHTDGESIEPVRVTNQQARASVRFGERFGAEAEVRVTPGGLLALGGMVGIILLGSAAIVAATGRARAEARGRSGKAA